MIQYIVRSLQLPSLACLGKLAPVWNCNSPEWTKSRLSLSLSLSLSLCLSYLDRAPSRIVETVEVKDLIRRISRPELRISTLEGASPAESKNVFISKCSYNRPEPVLVNFRFWYKMTSPK
eukprot:COSAG06_NODE_1352_length_9757_cov_3.878236_3_plen_120_part_00